MTSKRLEMRYSFLQFKKEGSLLNRKRSVNFFFFFFFDLCLTAGMFVNRFPRDAVIHGALVDSSL